MASANLRIGLTFDGQCEAAFKYYERCLNGTITFLLRWGQSPMAQNAPPQWGEKVLHATLAIGDLALVGADALPGTYKAPQGFSILFTVADQDEAERVFNALADGGAVRLPLQETFWAHRYGALTDQFSVPWDINCEKPA